MKKKIAVAVVIVALAVLARRAYVRWADSFDVQEAP